MMISNLGCQTFHVHISYELGSESGLVTTECLKKPESQTFV